MSRLIDADVLEKVMTEDWFLEILAAQDSKSAIKKDIVNCIDSVPLAYDVENVVAELEENGQKMSESKSSVPFGKCCPANHRYYKAISLNKAICIVERGGIE